MVGTHPDIFFYLFVLLGRDVDWPVRSVCQACCYISGITLIIFYFLFSSCFRYGRRGKDDAFYIVGLQLVVQGVSQTSGFITAEKATRLSEDPSDRIQVFQDLFIIGLCFYCCGWLIHITGVISEGKTVCKSQNFSFQTIGD